MALSLFAHLLLAVVVLAQLIGNPVPEEPEPLPVPVVEIVVPAPVEAPEDTAEPPPADTNPAEVLPPEPLPETVETTPPAPALSPEDAAVAATPAVPIPARKPRIPSASPCPVGMVPVGKTANGDVRCRAVEAPVVAAPSPEAAPQPRLRLPGGMRLDGSGALVPDDLPLPPSAREPTPVERAATQLSIARTLHVKPDGPPGHPQRREDFGAATNNEVSRVVAPVLPVERPPAIRATLEDRP